MMIGQGLIKDGKTIMLLQYAAIHYLSTGLSDILEMGAKQN